MMLNPYRFTAAGNGLLTNLVSYWPMGVTTDSHGSNTLSNGAENDANPVAAAAKNGNGYDFETSGETDRCFLEVADNASLSITGALSISCWVQPESINGTQDRGIVAKYDGVTGAYRSYHLSQTTGNSFSFTVSPAGDGTGLTVVQSATTMSAATMYHVVGVFSPSTYLRIYINGSQDGENTTSIPASIADTVADLWIGILFTSGAATGKNRNFDGLIDEVAIWNRALSSDDVTALYNSGTGLFYSSFE